MLRIALLTARTRPGTSAGAFLAFVASAVLVVAGGMLLEVALRTQPPVERYAGAAAVVTDDLRHAEMHGHLGTAAPTGSEIRFVGQLRDHRQAQAKAWAFDPRGESGPVVADSDAQPVSGESGFEDDWSGLGVISVRVKKDIGHRLRNARGDRLKRLVVGNALTGEGPRDPTGESGGGCVNGIEMLD